MATKKDAAAKGTAKDGAKGAAKGTEKAAAKGQPELRDIEAYTHDGATRLNNPPAGLARHDREPEKRKEYRYDPHISPSLSWAGKEEGATFHVATPSIHIHESIKPHRILDAVQRLGEAFHGRQPSLFGSPGEAWERRRQAIEFYRHGVDWTNRLIAGDSLIVMNSLLAKEGMAGKVQMCYFDPPYGIKYSSNFQPFVNRRDVKDSSDEGLDQSPQSITAFRDTWELGVHSYLSHLRDRLLLVRELLADSGSVFVQMSDENVHLVRCVLDEVFGAGNFVSMIGYATTGGFSTSTLSRVGDYLLWYAKDIKSLKYRQLFISKANTKGGDKYDQVELPDGTRRAMTPEEISGSVPIPLGSRGFRFDNLQSQGPPKEPTPIVIDGKTYFPAESSHWKANYPEGMQQLISANRVYASNGKLNYVRYFDDFPMQPISNAWHDIGGAVQSRSDPKVYVVQTGTSVIQRCLLMTTDPGDLVLDITCGSGTTAYVAEQWGRRWITCDTSRVALHLAKQRLMTACFDYYRLADEALGVRAGFVCKTVPHVTLKSIANNEPPAMETLHDQPEIDKSKIRISGPFTFEALPAPVGPKHDVIALHELSDLDDSPNPLADADLGAKHADWREELLATGIIGRSGHRLAFSRVEPLQGTTYLHAEAETLEDKPRSAVVCFAGKTDLMDSGTVNAALDEAEKLRPVPGLVVFAAFHFDAEAATLIEETMWRGTQLLKVQMNADLMTGDLKKKRSSNESFWLVGQPDVELVPISGGTDAGKHRVIVRGFDYYDVSTGKVKSGDTKQIVMWMLDTDYDGMCVEPVQVFFPMGGAGGSWDRLAKTLKAEIDQDLIGKYSGTESLPFDLKKHAVVAVKILDDRGIESMKVIRPKGHLAPGGAK